MAITFYTPCKTPRPIRCSEWTRQYAQDSVDGIYGREILENKMPVIDCPNFRELPLSERTDFVFGTIAKEAPIRFVKGELLVGSASIGEAMGHRVPLLLKGEQYSVAYSHSHLTANFYLVVSEGINAYEKQVREKMEQPGLTAHQTEVLKSFLAQIDAFHVYHDRYLAMLREGAEKAETAEDKAYFTALYENLERVPFETPRTFREGLQSVWFTFSFLRLCGNWPGIGRLDMMLGDLLEKDLANGEISMQEARELVAHFFIKGCEWCNLLWRGTGDGQHYQNLVIGGINEDGVESSNAMTRLILETVEEFPIADYPIAVRVSDQTPDWLWHKIAEVQRHGSGVVAIYNETLVIGTLLRLGYPLEEARMFANDGCWEVQIPGKTHFSYNPQDIYRAYQDFALCMDGREMPEYRNFEEFYAAYLGGMRDIIKKHIDWAPNVVCDEENSRYEVLPLVSLFVTGCIDNAASYEGGAKYQVRALHLGGLPDVANSMIAVRHLVFEEKKVTMAQLREILQANWEGHEDLRQYVKNTYAYYGNDSDEADELLARLMRDYTDEMDKTPYAGIVRVPAGISTFGRQIDWKDSRYAHAHGFFQGDILAGNISPTPSTDIKGATAVIRSCCKLDFTRLCGGTVLDIRLDPTCVNGDEGLAAIESLLRGFVALGGYFLQVDVLDTAVLLEAQKNPEKYQNLAVRVSGWSARFVTLNDNWQKMVIERTALGR